jgi:16S rRNA (guanine(966)-N(2))-methyltransferase RsmD
MNSLALRIISGKHKKRVIRPPKGMKERPTTDRAKEGLFNILQNRFDLDEVKVLDLFAGTGSISFEFCSRGEARVTAVERDRKLSSFIVRTAMELGMERLNVENKDVLRYLDNCQKSYDLIFADPPYREEMLYNKVLERIKELKLLNEGGLLILEHDERMDLSDREAFQEARSFGGSRFSFFVL